MRIDICLASDNDYVRYMGTTIASILKNSNEDEELVFHIIDGGIGEDNKNKILELQNIKKFNINFYSPNLDKYNSWFDKLNAKFHFSPAIFYRFEIPNILDVDKVLYLDSDIIVNKSLKDFFSIEIENYFLAVAFRKNQESFTEHKKRLNMTQDHLYFNNGVLLINNILWKNSNIYQEFASYFFKNYNDILFSQEVFNFVLKDRLKVIDEKYNFLSHGSFYNNNELPYLEDITIIHYITNEKPWLEYCPNLHFINEYWKYYMLTPWFRDNPSEAISIIIKQNLNNYKVSIDYNFSQLKEKLENTNKRLEQKDIEINNLKYDFEASNLKIEELKYNKNWIKLFGIFNNKEYLKIVIFGISIIFKIGPERVNKIAWWIPVRKWRDSFRKKFK